MAPVRTVAASRPASVTEEEAEEFRRVARLLSLAGREVVATNREGAMMNRRASEFPPLNYERLDDGTVFRSSHHEEEEEEQEAQGEGAGFDGQKVRDMKGGVNKTGQTHIGAEKGEKQKSEAALKNVGKVKAVARPIIRRGYTFGEVDKVVNAWLYHYWSIRRTWVRGDQWSSPEELALCATARKYSGIAEANAKEKENWAAAFQLDIERSLKDAVIGMVVQEGQLSREFHPVSIKAAKREINEQLRTLRHPDDDGVDADTLFKLGPEWWDPVAEKAHLYLVEKSGAYPLWICVVALHIYVRMKRSIVPEWEEGNIRPYLHQLTNYDFVRSIMHDTGRLSLGENLTIATTKFALWRRWHERVDRQRPEDHQRLSEVPREEEMQRYRGASLNQTLSDGEKLIMSYIYGLI